MKVLYSAFIGSVVGLSVGYGTYLLALGDTGTEGAAISCAVSFGFAAFVFCFFLGTKDS